MPGATGCGGLATKDDADLHLHQKSDGSTGRRLSALDPANFGAGLTKLWSQNFAWHFGHSNSLMQTASKFTVLSLLRRRNHRCWCCHNWCLFNLCVLARFYLQEGTNSKDAVNPDRLKKVDRIFTRIMPLYLAILRSDSPLIPTNWLTCRIAHC